MIETKLLKVKEVAAILRLSEADVYNLLHQKDLLPIMVGKSHGRYRIAEAEVERYIRNSQIKGG